MAGISATGYVVIGADGIGHSHAGSLWNHESTIFSGQVIVRSVIKARGAAVEATGLSQNPLPGRAKVSDMDARQDGW
ncbi:hypothetical protein E4U55_002967 [Claviceps digitariae]|nr:hypothetical protein E4U55_002967 [Claviceps digitariae]